MRRGNDELHLIVARRQKLSDFLNQDAVASHFFRVRLVCNLRSRLKTKINDNPIQFPGISEEIWKISYHESQAMLSNILQVAESGQPLLAGSPLLGQQGSRTNLELVILATDDRTILLEILRIAAGIGAAPFIYSRIS